MTELAQVEWQRRQLVGAVGRSARKRIGCRDLAQPAVTVERDIAANDFPAIETGGEAGDGVVPARPIAVPAR